MESYKNIERIYLEELPAEEVFVQKNTLKIALNLRARYLIGRVNNKEEYLQIIKTIKSRIILVLKSSKIPFFTKLNIVHLYIFTYTVVCNTFLAEKFIIKQAFFGFIFNTYFNAVSIAYLYFVLYSNQT